MLFYLLLLPLLSFPMCPTDSMPNWASCLRLYHRVQPVIKPKCCARHVHECRNEFNNQIHSVLLKAVNDPQSHIKVIQHIDSLAAKEVSLNCKCHENLSKTVNSSSASSSNRCFYFPKEFSGSISKFHPKTHKTFIKTRPR